MHRQLRLWSGHTPCQQVQHAPPGGKCMLHRRPASLIPQPAPRCPALHAKKRGGGSAPANKGAEMAADAPPTAAPSITSQTQKDEQQLPLPQVSPSLAGSPPLSSNTSSSVASEEQGQALKVLWRRLLIDLSSLPRAIALMAATFGFSALGTVIPQNKAFDYYIQNYPEEGERILGFLTYKFIFLFELDHIYTAWYFYLTIAWLAASLMACTSTRQWPAVKVAQRWRFLSTPVSVAKQGLDGRGVAEVLPSARVNDLGKELSNKGYQVFLKDQSLYAFKGLAGKLGPIGVHAALLLTLAGTAYSGFGGTKGSVMIPEGEDVLVGDVLRPVSPIASLPSVSSKVLHVNKFSIDYRPDGQVAQFYSDLSLVDPSQPSASQTATDATAGPALTGQELLRKTISVNDPFRYGGVTMYQTDWSLAAVRIRVLLGPPPSQAASSASADQDEADMPSTSRVPKDLGTAIELPMASLEGKPGISGRLWGSYLPVAAATDEELQQGRAPRGVSILARDPQSIVFYDTQGQFVGVRRPGSGKPINVEGVWLVADGVVGATGLELKSDPGVPMVYAGFGALMVTVLVSYLSHSQVWALQDGSTVYVGGRSNRAKLAFQKEMDEVLEAVPEVPVVAAGSQ